MDPARDRKPALIVLDYASPRPSNRTHQWELAAPWINLAMAALALLANVFPSRVDEATIALFVFFWLPSSTIAIAQVIRLRNTTDEPLALLKRKLYVITCWMALATLVLSIRYDQCPHARYFGIGPFEFTQGRACGNPRRYSNVVTVWFRAE